MNHFSTTNSLHSSEVDAAQTGPGGSPIIIGSPEELAEAVVNGWILDARSGGIVRGRGHHQGHIVLISPSSPLGVYELSGLMEGDEYLMSVTATRTHYGRLVEINSDLGSCDHALPTIIPGRVIDARAEPHDKLLLIGRQFIINRRSTRRHLAELITLNSHYPECSGQFLPDETIAYLELGDGAEAPMD